MACKPTSLSGSPTPAEVMDWISEMEMMFDSCNCSNKQKTALVVTMLKSVVLSWWKLLADTMPKGEANMMSWEDFLVQLKIQCCSEKDLLDINNIFQNLKKGRMSVTEYAARFMEKMKLVLYLFLTELSKVYGEDEACFLPSSD